MSETKTFYGDKVVSMKTWRLYDLFRAQSRILINLISIGGADLIPDQVRSEFLEYEKNIRGFLDGLIEIYNSEFDVPLNTEAESLTWDIDFPTCHYTMVKHPAPFIVRQFAFNNIGNLLVIKEIQRILGDEA